MNDGVSIILVIVFMLTACRSSTNRDESPLARVGDVYLHVSDIEEALRNRSPLQDSITYQKELVQSWVRQQILLQKAEQELPEADQDTRKQVEDYHRSLLIYQYEKKLLSTRLDTNVSEAQILDYFKKNKSNFELRKNLLRMWFVKADSRHKDLDKVRQLIQSTQHDELLMWCKAHAVNYFLDDQVWLDFTDVLKEIPIRTYNEEAFLNNNTYTEVKDGDFVYLVRIIDYRIRSSTSDPGMERERIREMIINQRKVKLLKTMELELIKEAELKKTIEVF
jgi:hypothetical protein